MDKKLKIPIGEQTSPGPANSQMRKASLLWVK